MATKQLPGLTTLLPADSIDSTADLMLVRDTSTNADVKVKVGTVVGRDHGTAANQVPLNSDLNLGTAATKNIGSANGDVPLNSDLGTAATKNTGTAAGQVPLFSDVTALVASETAAGLIEIATTAEAQAFSSNAVALTPQKLAQALTGSNQSLGANGYQKLPGGLIVQWGTITGLSTVSVTVTLPVSFPTACRSVVATMIGGPSGVVQVSTFNSSNFSINLSSNYNGGNQASWIAIGY